MEVYGFYESTLDGPERDGPYLIQAGYIKGSGPSFTATIQEVPGATASKLPSPSWISAWAERQVGVNHQLIEIIELKV